MVLKVEFLRPDGTPRYVRPLWLFWTGPTTMPLKALCLIYLWRFAIEHTFRFLKQHLGLNTSQSTDTICTDHWMWLCGIAYWQLLLMRDDVKDALPAWYPAKTISGRHARASPTGCFTKHRLHRPDMQEKAKAQKVICPVFRFPPNQASASP